METYILLIFLMNGFNSPTLSSYPYPIEFNSKKTCLEAGNNIKDDFGIRYFCVKK